MEAGGDAAHRAAIRQQAQHSTCLCVELPVVAACLHGDQVFGVSGGGQIRAIRKDKTDGQPETVREGIAFIELAVNPGAEQVADQQPI
jgi:hypothetical protein